MHWTFARIVALGVAGLGVVSASCTKQVDAAALSPQALQDRYGIAGAYSGQIPTPEGAIRGTIVPVTLPDGRKGQLIVPDGTQEYHPAYFQDEQGVHPIALQQGVTRDELVSAPPRVVAHQTEQPHARRPSWEKDVLLIGGGAAGGAGIGALAGGKKGAAIGAGAGGVGGLIYDLATRKR
jgi:hypothetical protein